ncbi:phage tail protein [Streptomyces sp. SID5910]|uniref:phage tail tube protein n=1 Tax=Streptomyces sp. SID5910 TaxID=2690312 RepID=UPI00136B7786|nr:phage tail protein [Streptomyces sp. SID5910]MYR43064.1 phage tail protein [Streptomyces sp. SID5910]
MADTRNADLTFGATDYLVHLAPINATSPTDFADLATPWQCLGWVTTDGGTFTIEEESQDVNAAGSLEPIRTLMTRSTKSLQVTFLEGLNPLVRSLYDNVPVASLKPNETTGVASYDFPDKPNDLRYAFVFDTLDGDKRMRYFMPNGKVVERGDEQPQTEDVMSVQMTFRFYKGASNTAAVKRFIDYGSVDVTDFFPTTP